MITQEELKEILTYNPLTGVFVWKKAIARKIRIGNEAGCLFPMKSRNLTYRLIGIHGKSYLTHRLVFLYMYGKFPKEQVDHKDGDGLNNKWSNLREVTPTENMKNSKLFKTNSSGTPGVTKVKESGNWMVRITVNGVMKYLGMFPLLEDAVKARKEAEKKYGFYKNHGRVIS